VAVEVVIRVVVVVAVAVAAQRNYLRAVQVNLKVQVAMMAVQTRN
jgi:hypothetical protein